MNSENKIPTISELTYQESLEEKYGRPQSGSEQDELLYQAGLLCIEQGLASISMFQRHFRIGFNRAQRLMNSLVELKVIEKPEGGRPSPVLLSAENFKLICNENLDPALISVGPAQPLFDEDIDIFALYESRYAICDKAEKLLSKSGHEPFTIPIRDRLRMDLRNFALYLSASDHVISLKETKFIEIFLDFFLSPQQAKERILKYNIYSETFENTLPVSLELLAQADNYKYHKKKSDPYFAFKGFEMFLITGRLFRDGKKFRSAAESRDYRIYMANIAALTTEILENGSIEVK